MVKLVNRAKMFTATTGTGTITLGAAVTGYQTFASAGVVDADVVRYVIEDGVAWEIGNGTYTSTGTTMSRTLIASSTGSLLNLSGNAQVFVSATAEDFAQLEATLPSTITVNSASAALTVTQTGTGNALVVEDSASPDTSPALVVTADGDVLMGRSTYSTLGGYRTLAFDATNGGNIEYYVSGTLVGEMFSTGAGNFGLGPTGDNELRLRTNGTTRVTITSAGLGVGMTPIDPGAGFAGISFGSSSGGIMDFYAGGNLRGRSFANTALMSFDAVGTSTYLRFRTNSTERLRIEGNGAWGLAGANYGTSGQALISQGTGTPPVWGNPVINRGTAAASTSGTAVDFTGIPSWVRRVTVMFTGVSTNGTSPPLIQLGTTSGFTSSGYLCSAADVVGATAANSTTGFQISTAVAASAVLNGSMVFENLTGNTWSARGHFGRSDAAQVYVTAGSVALAAALDRVRITTNGGTNTFDAGTINILWE